MRLAGLSAAGVVAGCSSGPATPGTSSVPLSSTPPSGPPDWDALSSKMTGHLLRPDNPDFEAAKRVFNPLFDGHNPIAVARCATPEDVQACVTAAAGRVPIAPRRC
jgi:hypothetical protein